MLSQVLLLGLLAGPAQLPAAGKPDSYYPLQVGNAWHYKVGDKRISTKVSTQEKIGDLMTARIETIVDGNVATTENVAQTAEGFARVAFSGQKTDKPVLFLKMPPKKGESWEINTKIGSEVVKGKFIGDEEEIEVPAGKYKTVTSAGEFEINGRPAAFKYWFAPNVGVVKLNVKFDNMDITAELQKFEPAK